MTTELATQRIKNCIEASKRTLNPQFYAYWRDTASRLARKYNVNLGELLDEESMETLGKSIRRESVR